MNAQGNVNITVCGSDVERSERKEIKRLQCSEGGYSINKALWG